MTIISNISNPALTSGQEVYDREPALEHWPGLRHKEGQAHAYATDRATASWQFAGLTIARTAQTDAAQKKR